MNDTSGESLKGLLTMPLDELAARIDAHDLSAESLATALKRPDLTEDHLKTVLDHTPWLSHHAVQVGLVNHPATPRVAAHKYIYFLFWKELVDVIGNMRVNAALRHAASQLLEEKIGEMSLGEKIAMAKTPVRGIVRAMRKMTVPQVTRAVLQNPATTEEDVLFILTRPNLSADILDLVGRSKKWVVRHDIRIAICRNPLSPPRMVEHLLTTLAKRELEGLAANPSVTSRTRTRARDLLKKRETGRESRGARL